jgi:alkanesulfonate monooxygenase SsuD/methylene tetrahydromethanopterin reductase-like flavin-dependent oxidoreductase (luciferase family)
MKFGLDLPAYWPDMRVPINQLLPELIEAARHGDEMGFSSLVLAEHHFIDYFVMPAPLALASHLAAVTKNTRIITSVIAIPFHDVRVLAGEIAVADHLTKGRLEIGFGSGGNQYEFERMGLPWDKTRIEIFDEKLKALLILLDGKDIAYDTPRLSFPSLTIMPPPLQKPYPPVWIAAVRPEAVYHSARRGFNVQTASLRRPFAVSKELVESFRTGAREAGAKSSQISFGQWVYVAKDDADIRRTLELALANHRRFVNLTTTPGIVAGGEVEPIATSDTVESLRDLVIVGTANYCAEKLQELAELGMDQLMIRMHFGPAHGDIMRSMDRFAEHVMPRLVGAARPDQSAPAAG